MKVNSKPMRKRIKELYDKDPTYADDDLRLIATIWYQDGWRDPELLKKLRSVSTPENIRRTRAKLREEGVIKTSKDVDEARFKQMQEAREDLA